MKVHAGGSRSIDILSSLREDQGSIPFARLSDLRQLRAIEQAAAVCYRLSDRGIEFLLVRTRGSGRWTFPKGSAEPGLTHAQVAALEASEEAGVHGRIEETSFASYVGRKRSGARRSATTSAEKRLKINAHLCQVLRLTKPKEPNRDRTWCSITEAKRRLREGRSNKNGAEFARVVDKAVARLERLQREAGNANSPLQSNRARQNRSEDALQRGRFEASDIAAWDPRMTFIPNGVRDLSAMQRRTAFRLAQPRKLLQSDVPEFSSTPAVSQSSNGAKKTRASAVITTND
jgi:8-oxo-dGTP pyrophosphatase MutT (NUDIX family)